ncbi:unnamed protein product [Phyllotreta striolata]|uniref:Uncharacterized protein n=1 Tax=Phyllotreta striolata TaxID=444603 RepID=A0A9N9TRP4_PHYSR|nr:unnamed protein product [Phyllotreta striolata]
MITSSNQDVDQNVPETEENHVEVNFGKTPFLTKSCKEIELNLDDKALNRFQIKRSPVSKPNQDVFSITPKEGDHKGPKLTLKCCYKPKIPNIMNYEKFQLTADNYAATISMRGQSLGPALAASTTQITFFQEPRHKSGRKVIEIKNCRGVPAPFSMHVDAKQKLFTVHPLNGVCASLTFVVINFNPPEGAFGTYAQEVKCMVQGTVGRLSLLLWIYTVWWIFQHPIVIQVVGLYSRKPLDPMDVSIIHYPFHFEHKSGYKCCFRDELEESEVARPVVLNAHYLELGRAVVKELYDDKSTIVSKNFSLKNNMECEVTVHWIEDDKVFSIYPKKTTVGAGESMIFKCLFKPTYAETCYNRMLTAQVYWKPHNLDLFAMNSAEVAVVPLTVSINLQGHSYKEGQMPLGNLEFIPTVLSFAISLPGESIYQNFRMVNKISRPVMFKLLPPCSSNVVMTPMAGMISDFVVVLAYIKNLKRGRPVDELWQVVLNGQNEKTIRFRVTAASHLPSISIADDNVVSFQSVQVNTVTKQTVFMYNTCNYNLSFKFLQPEGHYITVEPAEGKLEMHGKIPITVIFRASQCAPRATNVLLHLFIYQDLAELVGPNFEHAFTVYTSTEYSQLSATPLTDVFDLIEYGTPIETSFYIRNFGVSVVYFYLFVSCSRDEISLEPHKGQLEPNASMKINVKFECRMFGKNYVSIDYFNRMGEDSELVDPRSIKLVEFIYRCEMSFLKVSEIVEHDFGPLFSKRHFWNFFKADIINTLLDNMFPDHIEALEITLPDCPVGSRHYVTILLENESDLDTEVTLKKLKLCNCGYKPKPSKYRVEYILDCAHRRTLLIEMTQTRIEKRSSQMITIDVCYDLPFVNIMAYEVVIRPSRTLVLYFSFFGIPAGSSRISLYKNDLLLKMYGGVLSASNPPAQMFWFYNNSNIAGPICVDLSEVHKLNDLKRYKIFEVFYNGTTVLPKGLWPLMVRFQPIELIKYATTIKLCFNNESHTLLVEGYGSLQPIIHQFFETNMPESGSTTRKFPVIFSKDQLNVKCLPTWNYCERVIFIENRSKTRLIYFQWTEVNIQDVIKITVREKTGILRPGKSKSLTIVIESFNQSLLSSFVVTCTAMDLQLMYIEKKFEAIKEDLMKRKEEEFEFSDYPVKYDDCDKNDEELICPDHVNYQVSLVVNVHVIDRKDMHIFLYDPTNVFKFNSTDSMKVDLPGLLAPRPNKTNRCLSAKHEPRCQSVNADTIENVMEHVISDVVFNGTFPQIASTTFENYPPYYTQIKKTRCGQVCDCPGSCGCVAKMPWRREKAVYFTRPAAPVLADTFKTFIRDTVDGIFHLTPLEEQIKDENAIKHAMEHLSDICTVADCKCPSHKIV